MLNAQKIFLSVLFSLLVASCTTHKEALKPIDSRTTANKILAKDPASAAFHQYLIDQGYEKKRLPLIMWGLEELTLCALFYHTKLSLAKEQLSLANLHVETASVKKKPTINADIAHSNLKNNDIKPWAYGLSINIPVATNNKREIKIEKAEKYAESARMDFAATAWQLRNQIAIDLIAYHQNQAEAVLLTEELSTHANIASMLEKRVNAGVASKTEFSNVSLLALKTEHRLNEKHAQSKSIKAKLAKDVGLSLEKFNSIQIAPIQLDSLLVNQATLLNAPPVSKKLQADALLNRIDIRRSLADYAAAEAEIKLQAANQIPDITLSPGILFDFGDSIWSLGFSSLLNSLNKNTVFIEEAKQLRKIQGKKFEHLQAKTIAQLNQAIVHYKGAAQTAKQAAAQYEKQLFQLQKIQKQFDAGLIGKVALKRFILNNIVAKQQVLTSKFKLLRAANQIENVMQKPLYTTFSMPKLHDE